MILAFDTIAATFTRRPQYIEKTPLPKNPPPRKLQIAERTRLTILANRTLC